MISPQPDIRTLEIDPDKDSWMILACDGIWNFMSSQEVVDYVQQKIQVTPHNKLSSICEEVSSGQSSQVKQNIHFQLFQLFEHCLAPDTMGDGTGCDNMTAVIVKFNKSLRDLAESSPENGLETSEECNEPASKKLRLDSGVSERV